MAEANRGNITAESLKKGVSNIQLTASAYFYIVKKVDYEHLWNEVCQEIKDEIANSIIKSLKEVKGNAKDIKLKNIAKDYIIDCGWRTDGEIHYGICLFRLPDTHAPFARYIGDFWTERKTGYFVVFAQDKYIAVLKRNMKSLKCIETYADPVDYNSLTKLHQNNAKYTKISLRNIEGAENALQTKAYEAKDLKVSIPYAGISHYSIRSIRGKEENSPRLFEITPSTSRVGEATEYSIEDCINWIKYIVNDLRRNTIGSEFLSLFAEAVDYKSVRDELIPDSLLIYAGPINDILTKESTIHNTLTDVDVTQDELYSVIENTAEHVLFVRENGDTTYLTTEEDITLIKTEYGIRLEKDAWNEIEIQSEQFNGTLEDLINQKNLFNVYFKGNEYAYSNHTLFKDSRLLNSWRHLVSILDTDIINLRKTRCEKIEGRTFKEKKEWDDKSIFKVVEDYLNERKDVRYVICDDYEGEWADHIGIGENKISFYVEKYNDLTKDMNGKSSATDFQNIISQALKNLGNFTPLKKAWEEKTKKWKDEHTTSEIPCLRKGDKVENAIEMWKRNINNPLLKKEMCLVVNFLSLAELKRSLEQLEKQANEMSDTLRSTTYQRLWILSSFVNTCMEVGVEPKIYCIK